MLSAPGPARLVAQDPDSTRAVQREGPPVEGREQQPEAQDTVPADTVARPPTPLPGFAAVGDAAWVRGVWEWDREDLLRLPDLSLLNLLERVPGMVPVRADVAGQPEAAALFGAAAGAIRYVLDGFVLDPLTAPTFDPSRLSLLALERVRIERGITGATVRLETLTPDDARTKSVIEAGTGDYGINLFRGMFLPSNVVGGPLALGFERLAVNGFTPGVGNLNTSWLKWTWARDSAGIQVEYRTRTTDRAGVGEAVNGTRADWAVRARRAVGPLTAEAYVGGSTVEDQLGAEDSTAIREGAPQGGLRLAAELPGPVPTQLNTAIRFRGHPRLPTQELEVQALTRPLPWLVVEGAATQGWWSDGDPTGGWSARAAAGPFLGVQAFGELFQGSPVTGTGSGVALPGPDSIGVHVSRSGARAGVQLGIGGLVLGGAALQLSADTVYGFGLPMEDRWVAMEGGEARGLELNVRVPTGFDPLTIQGWYVGMDAPGWLYTPDDHWRAGLVYHHRPLPSGNLEIFARLEHVFRGRMHVPAGADAPAPTVVSDAYRATNLELTIRVVSVRAFLRWENLFHRRDQADLPAYVLPGQHIFWGVKWEFWN